MPKRAGLVKMHLFFPTSLFHLIDGNIMTKLKERRTVFLYKVAREQVEGHFFKPQVFPL